MKSGFLLFLVCLSSVVISCKKDTTEVDWLISDFSGSFKNYKISDTLLKSYSPGIYTEEEIPGEIKNLEFGRIEIDFNYGGGGLNYFMPLFYYGSINKNPNDDFSEQPDFHMAIEIGHYNVIPVPVEYLFYTICTKNFPRYCRDTYFPVITGRNYTLIVDKRPEGIILQLKEGDSIINVFPHAFFPDSAQMFFKSVTGYTLVNSGDSLTNVLMVGKGFAGIEKGIHSFNGRVFSVRIFKYKVEIRNQYEIQYLRNQHTENEKIKYIIKDNLSGSGRLLKLTYEFSPYRFESGEFYATGEMKTGFGNNLSNNGGTAEYSIRKHDIGLYKIYINTLDETGKTIVSTSEPFQIWVYPKEWNFKFY